VTTTSGSHRVIRRRVAAGVLAAAGLGVATVSAASSAPAAAKSPTLQATTGARTASAVRPAGVLSPPTCPKSTYPSSPTSKTGYGVAFSGAILNGTLNAGYHETPNPPNNAYAPWGLHIGSLTGSVCGLIQIPSLQLSATPSDIQIATYGQMSGPATIAPGQTAPYSFTGLADPGANQVAFNLANFDFNGNQTSAQSSVAYYNTGQPQELSVSNIVLKNQPAGVSPGPLINSEPEPYQGTLTLTNTSGQKVKDIQGEEPEGFISGPTTLGPGKSATYTFTTIHEEFGNQDITIPFTGETATGPVTGFAVVYFSGKGASGPAMTIGNIMINGQAASSAPGPSLIPGAVFTTTFTITNESTTGVTLNNLTNAESGSDQSASVLLLSGLASQVPYGYTPFALHGFGLTVSVPCAPGTSGPECPADLFTSPNGTCGATDLLPPNYCQPPNALSAAGVTSANSLFTLLDPAINCDQSVSVAVTTGRSTVVPQQVTGADRSLPVWTMEGQGIVGPLVGAEGTVVANNFGLTIRNTPTPLDPDPNCSPYDADFDLVAGGVTGANNPVCKAFSLSYCYYNGKSVRKVPCINNTAENICGPPGEVQLSAQIVVTSVDLPTYNPQTAAAVKRG
jgi:hypothetical protein